MMNSDKPNSFGAMLKKYRQEAKKSLRDLGAEANVPHSVIAAIEAGRRSVSTEVALCLAKALGVKDKDAFLLKAISTTKRQKILPFAKAYSAEVLNFLAIYLAHAGIMPEHIADCRFDASADEMNFVSKVMEAVERAKQKRSKPRVFLSGATHLPRRRFVIETNSGQRFTVTILGQAEGGL